MQVHVIVTFPSLPPMHFRAEAIAARAFREEMTRWHDQVSIHLDFAVLPSMPRLPCHRLFENP